MSGQPDKKAGGTCNSLASHPLGSTSTLLGKLNLHVVSSVQSGEQVSFDGKIRLWEFLSNMMYPYCAMLGQLFLEYSWMLTLALDWIIRIWNSSITSRKICQKRYLLPRMCGPLGPCTSTIILFSSKQYTGGVGSEILWK